MKITTTVKMIITIVQFGIMIKSIFSDKKSILDDVIALIIMLGLCTLNLSIPD